MIGTGRSAEELRGQQDPTHFGRMLQDLGIGFIAAQSPQAKGRIERLWGTLQDRLVSELRLRRSRPSSRPTRFSRSSCPPSFGASRAPPRSPPRRGAPRRAISTASSAAATRASSRGTTPCGWAPAGSRSRPGPRGHSYAGCRVELRELLDGRLVVLYQDTLLAAQPAPAAAFVLTPRSDPGRDRQRVQHSPRARSRQLQAAVVALTRTLRSRRPTPAPAVAASAPNSERSGGAQGRDRSGGGYLAIPRRRANPAVPGDTSPSVPHHPWRTTFSPRQRRLDAAKRG